MNIFVFRISSDSDAYDFVRNELKNGRLRQGWGNHKAQLKAEMDADEWIQNYVGLVSDESRKNYRRKHTNLMKMLEIESGDLLVVPKAPKEGCFSICKAIGGYTFAKPDNYSRDDFYHFIPIDKETIREYSYYANESCSIIKGKIRAYQSALNAVYNTDFREAVCRLYEKEQNSHDICNGDVGVIAADIKREILYGENVKKRYRNLGNKATELIVKAIFEKMGYEYIKGNSYDGEDGDADLIFADNSFTDLKEVAVNSEDVGENIYIQIKNKKGKDYNDLHGAKQLVNRTKDCPAATKVLISTADEYTEDCIRYASENNILLIDVKGFLELVFRYLD